MPHSRHDRRAFISATSAALAAIARDRPSAFRVAFGRRSALAAAVQEGVAQATADDPSSAKCLGELLRKGRLHTPS